MASVSLITIQHPENARSVSDQIDADSVRDQAAKLSSYFNRVAAGLKNVSDMTIQVADIPEGLVGFAKLEIGMPPMETKIEDIVHGASIAEEPEPKKRRTRKKKLFDEPALLED